MRIYRTLAAVALVISLAACGGPGNGASSGGDGKGDVTFFSWDNEATMKPLITEFEKENPGITIKFSYAPPVQQYNDTLSKRLLAGQAADVFILGNKAEQVRGGYVRDLSDLQAVKELSPFNLKQYSYENKPYGVSVASWGGGLAVNLDLLKKAGVTAQPQTWAELLQDLGKLKSAGVKPMLEPSDGVSTTVMALIGYADAQGGGLDDKIWNGGTTFSAAWTKPLERWSQLYSSGLVPKQVAGLNGDQVQTEFVSGRVAMIATGSWVVAAIKQGAPKMNWTFWPIPGDAPGQDFWAGAASPPYAINSKAKNPAGAEKWINFLASNTGTKIYHETTGSITTTSTYKPELDASLEEMYPDVVKGNIWCTWQAWPGPGSTTLDATMLSGLQKVILGQGSAAAVTKALDEKLTTLK